MLRPESSLFVHFSGGKPLVHKTKVPKFPKGAKKPKENERKSAEKPVSLKPLKVEDALARALKPKEKTNAKKTKPTN